LSKTKATDMAGADSEKRAKQEQRINDVVNDVTELGLSGLQETAWAEVIAKMEEVYSDLIQYDIDLEHKNTELEETHQFVDSVISSMSEILIVCDRDQCVEQINKATEDLTGFRAQELVGKNLKDLIVDPDSCLLAALCSTDTSNQADYCEVRLISKMNEDGSDPVSMNGSVRIDHQGRPAGIVIIGRPMGELRRAYQALNKAHADLVQAQQRLVQSEKLASLGRLVAGVAHELNNPISFINGNIHSLEKYKTKLLTYFKALDKDAFDKEEQNRLRQELKIDRIMEDLDSLVEGTLEGAARVRDIVKNLRRLTFNGTEQSEPFDLVQTVRTGVSWVKRSGPKPTEIMLDLPKHLNITGNPGRIHQVIVNLVENALDAVRDVEKPTVKVAMRTTKDQVIVTVSDNGCGISAENQLKVFDPFFTTKSVGEGTGLGLWISYDLVQEHNGKLSIESELDKGTTLTMVMPLA